MGFASFSIADQRMRTCPDLPSTRRRSVTCLRIAFSTAGSLARGFPGALAVQYNLEVRLEILVRSESLGRRTLPPENGVTTAIGFSPSILRHTSAKSELMEPW